MHDHEIQSAVNTAEAVVSPITPKGTAVTVNSETLLLLIEAAKLWLDCGDE